MKRIVPLVLLMAASANAACYSYSPIGLDELAVGTEVRTRVSPSEIDRFRDHVPVAGYVVEGRFRGRNGDRIFLDVPVSRSARGMRMETIHQRIDVAAAEVFDLEAKELDRGRTLLVTAAGVAVVAGLVLPRLIGRSGTGTEDGGDPEAEDRVLFRIVIPLGR